MAGPRAAAQQEYLRCARDAGPDGRRELHRSGGGRGRGRLHVIHFGPERDLVGDALSSLLDAADGDDHITEFLGNPVFKVLVLGTRPSDAFAGALLTPRPLHGREQDIPKPRRARIATSSRPSSAGTRFERARDGVEVVTGPPTQLAAGCRDGERRRQCRDIAGGGLSEAPVVAVEPALHAFVGDTGERRIGVAARADRGQSRHFSARAGSSSALRRTFATVAPSATSASRRLAAADGIAKRSRTRCASRETPGLASSSAVMKRSLCWAPSRRASARIAARRSPMRSDDRNGTTSVASAQRAVFAQAQYGVDQAAAGFGRHRDAVERDRALPGALPVCMDSFQRRPVARSSGADGSPAPRAPATRRAAA